MYCNEINLNRLKQVMSGYSSYHVRRRCLVDMIRMKRAGHQECGQEMKLLHQASAKIAYVDHIMDAAEQWEGIGMRVLLWRVLVGKEDLKKVADDMHTEAEMLEMAIDTCLCNVMYKEQKEAQYA